MSSSLYKRNLITQQITTEELLKNVETLTIRIEKLEKEHKELRKENYVEPG